MPSGITIQGDNTAETLSGSAGNDEIYGGGGNDSISGGGGNDNLFGDDGNDSIFGGAGNDRIYGGGGDDRLLIGGSGNQLYDGGDGFDTFDASTSAQAFRLDLSTGVGKGSDNFTTRFVERVIGSRFSDSLTGSTGDDVLETNGGDDTLNGGDGADTLIGGAGNDRLNGNAGADTLVYDATTGRGFTHTWDGGSGADTLELRLTSAQYTAAAQAEIAAFKAFLADPLNAGKTFSFSTVGFMQVSNVETVRVLVDGVDPSAPANSAPLINASATDASLIAGHNSSVTGTIAATDANGDTLTYSVRTGPANGTVTFTDANGSYVYQAGDFVGADSFTVQVSDGHGGLATQVVTIASTNADPLVWPSSTVYFDVGHGQAYDGQIVVTDADGDVLQFSVLDAPAHGTITFTDAAGHYTYQAIGAFETDIFTLQVSDGHGGVATLTVNVTDPNSVPVITDGASVHLVTGHNASVAGSISATDAENDPLTYTVETAPQHGSVTFTDTLGNYVYTAGDYVGTDTFTLLVDDGYGGLVSHAVTVEVTNAGPQIAPESTSALAVTHGNSVAGAVAGVDANGDSLTYSVATGPTLGTLTFTDSHGNYVYQAAGSDGADSFVLQVSDGHGGIALQTVTVAISNTGPSVAAGTTATANVMHNTSFAGTVLGADADGDSLTYSMQSGPKLGTLQFTDANGHYSYAAGDAAGADSFTLQINDGHGGIATQTVNVSVIGTWDLSANATGTVINLGTGAVTGTPSDLLQYAIDIKGSAFADTITGDARDNALSGGDGKDELHGAGGSDRINGGVGDDKLFGEDGNDYLDGGSGVDALNGGAGDDVMLGGAGNDGFFGGGGSDRIYGGDGNDRIYGDGGNDTIFGGAGNDTLAGGGSSPTLVKGNNTFAWVQADAVNASGTSVGLDHVTDFGAGDRIDFSGMFASKPAVLSSVIHVTDTTAGTVISASVGAGGAFVDVVVLDGVHLSLDDLNNAHQIIV